MSHRELDCFSHDFNNNLGQKVNVAETNFMDSYILDDAHYDEATELVAYMGERDVNMVQSMLKCNQGLKEGKPPPRP